MSAEELERRIHEVLDAGRAPEEDPELAEAFREGERGREAATLAEELAQVDAWVRGWEPMTLSDDGFAALAARVEQRLDESLAPIDDPTLPPVFDDEDSWRRPKDEAEVARSGEYALDALTQAASGAGAAPAPAVAAAASPPAGSPPAAAAPAPEEARAEVVDLASRRESKTPWILAAAAVAGLALTGSLMWAGGDAEEAQSVAMAPAAEEAEPAERGAAALDDAFFESAEGEAEPTAQAAPAEAPAPSEQGGGSAGSFASARGAEVAENAEVVEAEEAAANEPATEGIADQAVARPGAPSRRRARRSQPAPTMSTGTASSAMAASTRSVRVASALGGARDEAEDEAPRGPGPASARAVAARTAEAVARCFGGDAPADLSARLTIEGPTGRVRRATVESEAANESQRRCVRRALESATVPEGGTAIYRLRVRWD